MKFYLLDMKTNKYVKSYRSSSGANLVKNSDDAKAYASKATARSAQNKLGDIGYDVLVLTEKDLVENNIKNSWLVFPFAKPKTYYSIDGRPTTKFENKNMMSFFDAHRMMAVFRAKGFKDIYIDQLEADYVGKMREEFIKNKK